MADPITIAVTVAPPTPAMTITVAPPAPVPAPTPVPETPQEDLIFVQIASYRDPQLGPTIDSMLETADHPERLVFGICLQYSPGDDPDAYDGRPNFRVYKAPYTESKGLCWARAITNSLHRGERYTLQIDSHHRFLPHWDTMVIEDYHQAKAEFGVEKPIITAYVPPFTPGQPLADPQPCLMAQLNFTADKLLNSIPWFIPHWRDLKRVVRARTLSGHFYFTDGTFIGEVPYDEAVYYGSTLEEITMSARAFTHGYDFFSPHRCYLYHEYTRTAQPKIWEDKPADSGKWDSHARNRARQLQGQEDHGIDLGIYGLGTRRTFHDWEVYAGLDFKNCRIAQYTLEVREPPNPLPWEDGFVKREHTRTAKWDMAKIKDDLSSQMSDLKCLTLGFETQTGLCIHRADMTPATHPDVFTFVQDTLTVTFSSCDTPTKWVLWPLFENDIWGTRQEGTC
jgi:hypothetical protein